ncbi:FAD-binding and (Fe-S)-binding domain-containing protein [Nocardia callitridis]|uniref:FAD-binding and (Fe-S)-binding domain-containing protein n=1 Tax=Nocardia callitridis TaxID=648753 RepID=A0ABP9KQP4_9NOCA
MTTVRRQHTQGRVLTQSDSDTIGRALRSAGLEVRDDAGTRGMYASDASLYRIPPLAVVRPRTVEEVATALAVSREHGVPLTSRGAGTSVAGNAVGRGIVLDFSRYLDRVLAVDPQARTAIVEPGTVHATLQRAVTPHGIRFGPDPSTHTRCTIGGMIGNNACGSRSLAYGRTSDNIAGLELLTADGQQLVTGYDEAGAPFAHGADEVIADVRLAMTRHLATARTEFDRFGRQVSGYAAQHLLPERFDLTRALVGSEGTLAVITRATVRLVADASVRVVVVLGFSDIVAAGAAAPSVVAHGPTACEGLDSRLIDVLRERRGPDVVPTLPRGRAWLFVEFAGAHLGEVEARAEALAAADIGETSAVVTDPVARAGLWRVREDGAGLAGRAPSSRPAWPGWEDSAVPPARLGEYLARFDELVTDYGMTSAPYGHFGEGCIHVRLDFPLERTDSTRIMREFLTEAARLVGGFGGSLSGEHGDGRARSELLPQMYSTDAISMFGAIKAAFDPSNLLNPGVLVDPDPIDVDVRPATHFPHRDLAIAYPHDGGSMARAVHRCTGVGKCRADNSPSGGVMCPSYQATSEEKDSTRGRARVLQEVVRGELAWSHPSVHDAMDLCLSCKGCSSDCPSGIDMATYKSEVLHQTYRRRLRPRSHYSLGKLPMWARWAGWVPRAANAMLTVPGLGRVLLWLAGVDRRRSVPRFARRPFRRMFEPTTSERTPVVLFADSFSDAFDPEVAEATVRVLRAAGYEPRLPSGSVCCAITWITTGQLDSAKKILARTVDVLAADAMAGLPIVGIEPSCTAALRADMPDLLPGNDRGAVVSAQVMTLAELLAGTPGWSLPDLTGTEIIAQPHCHHHAVLGWHADAELLAASGATVRTVAGCCGLAGNFGVERGHYDVSVAVAEQNLLPAVDAAPEAVVLADGFSCRTQLADLRHRNALHLAQLLDATTDATSQS